MIVQGESFVVENIAGKNHGFIRTGIILSQNICGGEQSADADLIAKETVFDGLHPKLRPDKILVQIFGDALQSAGSQFGSHNSKDAASRLCDKSTKCGKGYQRMGPSKKGLHKANPENQKTEIETYKTKRLNTRVKITPVDNEREFRQMLAQKVSGTSVGLWLLVPELIKLGAWDLLKGWSGKSDVDLAPRIAMQVINETALCINRVRRKNSLGHQGFQLLNGMGRLVTDEQVHSLLDNHTMEQNKELFINLGIQRHLSGHYQGALIAIDPHRIFTSSKRIMAKKRKDPQASSQKMLQKFLVYRQKPVSLSWLACPHQECQFQR